MHKRSHDNLDPGFIRQTFNYSPHTGEVTWNVALSRRIREGARAGFLDDQGRIKIGIEGKEYFAHRIIWVWMTGVWPTKEIDHINKIKSDNRWTNLREATPSENHRNRGKQRNNTTGYKGVTFDKRRGCYIAGVKLNGKRHNVRGRFETAEEAYQAVKNLALTLHGAWSTYT